MSRRWIHPLWTHIPASVILVGFAIISLSSLSNWPDRVPLRIAWSGVPATWGTPWTAFGLVLGIGSLFLALTVLVDELWARQESLKRFNVLSLLDEFAIAFLVTIHTAFLRGQSVYRLPWGWLLLVVGGAMLVGVWLEMKRPYRASDELPAVPDTAAFRKHLEALLEKGERIVFWDVQNPKYVAWLSLGLPLALWTAAFFLFQTDPWAAVLEVAAGILFLLFYGGQRTRVTREGITIRYGFIGFRIFRCRLSELSSVRVRTFAPLADFGGYGIRISKGVTAYYLFGRTGVQLELIHRRSALIGSQHPERLAAVIEALRETTLNIESEVAL